MRRKSEGAQEWEKPSRAPQLKGRRGMEARVGLMRVNPTRVILMGCATNVCQTAPHDDSGSYDDGTDPKVQATRPVPVALHWPRRGIRARSSTSSQGAAYRLAAAWQPPAGSNLESARLEMARGVPRDLASKPATSRPDEESWDFDGSEQDFNEEKNPPKPHAYP
jgi:hypothetical protein